MNVNVPDLKDIKKEITNLHQIVDDKSKEILASISDRKKILVKIPPTRLIVGIIFSIIGLAFFVFPIYSLHQHSKDIAFKTIDDKTEAKIIKARIAETELKNSAFNNAMMVSVICGILIEIIALINFYSYNKNFEIYQRLILAEQMCDNLSNSVSRQKTYAKIISSLIKG